MSELVGLIPAAGLARRLAPLPCSKEIFPVGVIPPVSEKDEPRPKPVGMYLMERMLRAGAERAYIIINKNKTDILRYFGSGRAFQLPMAYLVQEEQSGMPDALDQAYPWLKADTILFGMPDTIFQPEDAYVHLLAAHNSQKYDVTLGLFPTLKPERFGMVAFDQHNHFLYTVDKPAQTDLTYMWGIGCWGPVFSDFMHSWLRKQPPVRGEIVLADIFQAAQQAGLRLGVVPYVNGEYVDIGSLDDLAGMLKRFTPQ